MGFAWSSFHYEPGAVDLLGFCCTLLQLTLQLITERVVLSRRIVKTTWNNSATTITEQLSDKKGQWGYSSTVWGDCVETDNVAWLWMFILNFGVGWQNSFNSLFWSFKPQDKSHVMHMKAPENSLWLLCWAPELKKRVWIQSQNITSQTLWWL